MVDMAHPSGFCLPQSPQGRRTVHSKPIKKPVVPPVKEQKPEDPQVSGEPGTEVTGRGGKRVGKILPLPGWRSKIAAITPGCGRTLALGLPASSHLSHHDTFSAKATLFRAKAGLATRTHGQVPVYTPERDRAPRAQRPRRVRLCGEGEGG